MKEVAERVRCEFQLLRWVPNVVRGEFATIGVVLREAAPHGRVMVRLTRSWSRVRAIDAAFDADLMEDLADELAQRLAEEEQDSDRRPLLTVARSSFSTGLQITEPTGCLAEDMEVELLRLWRMYVERPKAERQSRKQVETGRPALLRGLRREFEIAGVWPLMRKGFAAAQYTGTGDRLRIDCGYRVGVGSEGTVQLLQAVSLASDAEGAKVLAFSAARLRDGVRRVERANLRLTAIVEQEREVASPEAWRFAVSAMQAAGIEVARSAELPRLAARCRQEMAV